VQLAIAEPEPGAGKRERRPLDLLKAQDLAVESPRPLEIGHRQADMVQKRDVHPLASLAS
jgi:hypothetical protein